MHDLGTGHLLITSDTGSKSMVLDAKTGNVVSGHTEVMKTTGAIKEVHSFDFGSKPGGRVVLTAQEAQVQAQVLDENQIDQ